MSADARVARPSAVVLVGDHRSGFSFEPGFNRRAAELAAGIVADCFEDVHAYTAERAQAHIDELTKFIRVSCTCKQRNCGLAQNYARGLLEGWRSASIIMMSYALNDQLRARQASAPLLPPEIKFTLPKEFLAALAPTSKEINVKRHPDGSSTATIQQITGELDGNLKSAGK